MSQIQLRQIDLNLLVVLDVLLRERGITSAARVLHVTPSAVSHALKRLRTVFNDELLVRDGRRMRPTTRAEGLAETLPRVLQQLEHTLSAPEPFDPRTSTRTFRLAAPDFVAPLVPGLLQRVERSAPNIRVELVPLTEPAIHALAEGRYDVLVGPSAIADEGVRAEPLGSWTWFVFGRAGHPGFASWSLSSWLAHPHLQIGTSALRGTGPVERQCQALRIQRTIGAVVPYFTMAAPILAQTNLLLTVPAMTMATTAAVHGLAHREVPFPLPDMALSLFRSAAAGDEPGVRWFRDQVLQAARALWTVSPASAPLGPRSGPVRSDSMVSTRSCGPERDREPS